MEVLRFYELDSTDIDWFSSSLGSTILIDAFSRGRLSGRSSILLAPNSEFKFPIWARAMIIMPLPRFMYSMFVRLAVWAVERKVKEEGQRIRYRRALLSQDLQKMHLSARSLIRYSLPEYLEGISYPCAVMTGYGGAVYAGNIKPETSVVVIGCGAVGLSAIQGARISGASKIIAVDIFDNKLEFAKKVGATHTINSKIDNPIEACLEITDGRGVDLSLIHISEPTRPY